MLKDNSFFSQGSYGCVSHPPLKCPASSKGDHKPPHQGEGKMENKMVSKLVRNDVFAKNELHMGMKLKEILKQEAGKLPKKKDTSPPSFLFYTKSCDVHGSELNDRHYKKCNILHKENTSSYVILYGQYVRSMTLSQYFSTHTSLQKFYDFFVFSLKIIRIFLKHKIIHKDLKENNIVVTKENTFHVVDFGNSMDVSKYLNDRGELVFKGRISELFPFFVYAPYHHYWSPEYHLICYLFRCIHRKQTIQDRHLRDICGHITNDNLIYKTEKERLDGNADIYAYFIKKCAGLKMRGDYINYNEKKYLKCIEILCRGSRASWDSYAICYSSLRLLHRGNHSNLPITKVVLDGLHYDCRKRLKLNALIKAFHKCVKV